MASVSPRNKAQKACTKRGVAATTVEDLNLIIDEEMTASRLADFGQKLEEMRKMIVDLSTRVEATEDQQREVGESQWGHPPPVTHSPLAPSEGGPGASYPPTVKEACLKR